MFCRVRPLLTGNHSDILHIQLPAHDNKALTLAKTEEVNASHHASGLMDVKFGIVLCSQTEDRRPGPNHSFHCPRSA